MIYYSYVVQMKAPVMNTTVKNLPVWKWYGLTNVPWYNQLNANHKKSCMNVTISISTVQVLKVSIYIN